MVIVIRVIVRRLVVVIRIGRGVRHRRVSRRGHRVGSRVRAVPTVGHRGVRVRNGIVVGIAGWRGRLGIRVVIRVVRISGVISAEAGAVRVLGVDFWRVQFWGQLGNGCLPVDPSLNQFGTVRVNGIDRQEGLVVWVASLPVPVHENGRRQQKQRLKQIVLEHIVSQITWYKEGIV